MKKYINQQDMKQENALDVLSLVRSSGGLTRKEIENLTSLSWGAVSNITARLLKDGYLSERKAEPGSGAGRTPGILEANVTDHFIIGMDINASGFDGVLINLRNEIIASVSEDAPETADMETLLTAILAFSRKAADLAGEKHVLGMGAAMQGEVDSAAGISVSLPYCPEWKNVPLASILSEELGIPVFIGHDPDCLLYSWTQTEESEDTVLIRADNGIGMAVLLDGKIGTRPGMYEIGHLPAAAGGEPCPCGRRGCLECYASRSGMARRAGTRYSELRRRAEGGDAASMSFFEEGAGYLSDAIVRSARFLAIKNVVLCGRLIEDRALFTDRLLEKIGGMTGGEPLSVHVMEQENAAYGAALIAVERSLDR